MDPIPVEQLCSRRSELTEKGQGNVVYDPRPVQFRSENSLSVEHLRCDLLKDCCTESCALLTILVPSVQSIQHDHTCARSELYTETQVVSPKTPNLTSEGNSSYLQTDHSFTIVENLCLTNEQRLALEACTRQQNDCTWHQTRQYRITVWVNFESRTEALLRSCLYPKPFEYTPKQIAWGPENEPKARKAYVEYMKSHGHTNLKAHASGFFVHSEKGWLGASPDACVSDPDATEVNGIAELKCPFSKADVPVDVACEASLFYCSMTSSHGLRLNRSPHQVQLQLYTSGASWCDFRVYTTKNVAVERIYPDLKWQQEEVPKLDSYFFDCMLPEIVCPKAKPSYFV